MTVPVSSPMAASTGAAGAGIDAERERAEAGPVLPAASVAVSVIACGPSPSGVAGVKLQVPAASVTTLPSTAAPSRMVMMAPGLAVPAKAGVVSSVVSPSLIAPVTVPISSLMAASTGAAGRPVSTLNASGAEAGPVLPAASVAVSVIECGPSPSGVAGVKLQVPAASVTTLPSTAAPSRMVTMAPGSAAAGEGRHGVVGGVAAAIAPVTVPISSLMAASTGAAGRPVSTLNASGAEAGPVLPAASVAVSVIECGPSPSGVAGVKLQVPEASVTTLPSTAAPSRMVTMAPGSAVPAKAGMVSSVVSPPRIAPVTVPISSLMVASTGAAGGTSS